MEHNAPMRHNRSVRLALCLLLVFPLITSPVAAQETGPLAEERATRTIFDTTPPEPGTVSAPEVLQQGPIPVSYSGAQDDGAGLQRVTLWVRHGEDQPWEETELSSESGEGEFLYTGALGDGTYEFALVAEDKAGNVSATPEGPGAARTILDNTPPVITVKAAGASVNIALDAGTPFVDPGATAIDNIDGDISNRIVVGGSVDVNTPGTYMLTYDVSDTAGNAAEQRERRVEILPSLSYTLSILSPSSGSIQATPPPDTAGKYSMGTVVTLVYHAPTGSDLTVQSWQGAEQDPTDPKVASVVMSQNRTVGVSLMQPAGSVQVSVTPQSASWVVTDSSGATHSGFGNQQLANLPPGTVSVAFNSLEGYQTPAGQSAELVVGGSVTFTAEYEPMGAFIVSVPSGQNGFPGETVSVPVNLSNRDGLQAYSVTISFDADALSFEDLAAGSLVAAWGAPTASPAAGALTISGSGPALSGSGGGSLAMVTLRVNESAESGQYPLTVSSAALNQGGIPVQTANGSIVVHAMQWVWGDVDGNGRADDVDANLIKQYATGRISILPFQEAAGDPNFIGPANVKGDDPPSITVQDANLINRFVRGQIATFPADLDDDGFGPESPEDDKDVEMPAEVLAAKGQDRIVRTLGSVIAEPGVEIRVPVSIDSASGVWGYLFELEYDPNVLEFLNVSKGPLAESWIEPIFHSVDGVLRWANTSAERLTGAGQLSIVTFRGRSGIAPSTATPLTLTRAELNDKMINVTVDANTGAPALESVTPPRGATDGFAAITLRGANLAHVDTVLIGGAPAAHVFYDPSTASLRVITPPRAGGPVNITASTLGLESTLEGAFEYYEPEIHIALEPDTSAFVGDFFQIPVLLTNRAQGVNRLSFVLNFDPTIFARSTIDDVVIGGDGAGVQVAEVRSVGAGRLSITLEGTIRSGHAATINLVVTSPGEQPDTLIVVTDGQASAGGESKSVSGGSAIFSGQGG